MRKKIEQLAEDLASRFLPEGMELVDVEYVKEQGENYLRVLIDKQGGVNLEDCEFFSRILDKELDEADFIKDSYYLEVSSPGLDRELKKDKDFVREKGKKILIKQYKKSDLGKEFEAILCGLDEEKNLIVQIDGKNHIIQRKDIAKVNLHDFEF